MNVGFDIIHPKTGTWFLFHREYNFKFQNLRITKPTMPV